MSQIIFNEDFENFMACYPLEKMSEAGLREQLDHYAAGGAKTILFCGNGMRAMFDSHAFEPLWKDVEERDDGRLFFRGREILNEMLPVKDNVRNCKKLFSAVVNPFKTRIDYGRSLGMKIGASMRMNDVHLASTPDSPMNSDFWRAHQECRVAPYRGDWPGNALDYARPEVYQHHLSLVREYLTRFDLDGIELDWLRTPPHFKPGFELQGAGILTAFMRETRAITDAAAHRHGHPVEVTVRVPSCPDGARRNGFEVRKWVDDNLVDRVAVSSYWGVTDYDIPLELWRQLLGGNVKIAAGLEIICRSHPQGSCDMFNTKEIVFGHAASFYYRGADEIYLFNHMDGKCGMPDKDGFREVLETVGSRERTESRTRRHVVS